LTAARCSEDYSARDWLLNALRGRDDGDRDEILRRIALPGCALGRGAVAICAAFTDERSDEVLAVIASECPDALVAHDTASGPREGTRLLYALVPGSSGGPDKTTDLAEATLLLARRLGARIGRHATVGLSSYRADPSELSCAIQEAELMLEVLLRADAPLAGGMGGNGTYGLLFGLLSSRPEELRLLYRDTLAPLVGYDKRYHTELVATLKTYLSENCNMNATANTMLAHRHTISSRLDRIRELTGLDPGRSEDREWLGLGLKAGYLIGLQEPC
jgi:DNA-binding PucR family transcriptional regulator